MMKRLDRYLRGSTWDSAEQDAKQAFADTYRGFKYGQSQTLNAWNWWYDGWLSALLVEAARSERSTS